MAYKLALSLLAASSVISPVAGAPIRDSVAKLFRSLYPKSGMPYNMYLGDGTEEDGWPQMNEWADWETLWEANLPLIENSCGMFNVTKNSDAETASIKKYIKDVCRDEIDPRFVLAIMMEETGGCVRAPTNKFGSHVLRGLMQSHDGMVTCNGDKEVIPCAPTIVYAMIADGVYGYSSKSGLVEFLQKAQSSSAQGSAPYYVTARYYDSFEVDSSHALEKGKGKHCFASNVANRLVGWAQEESTCCLDTTCPPASGVPCTTGPGATHHPPLPTGKVPNHEGPPSGNPFPTGKSYPTLNPFPTGKPYPTGNSGPNGMPYPTANSWPSGKPHPTGNSWPSGKPCGPHAKKVTPSSNPPDSPWLL